MSAELGVWRVTYKKATGRPRVDYDAAVEEALCFGWIEIARLIAGNLMMPSGLAKVQPAKRDGSWSKLDAVEALTVRRDLAVRLAAYGEAQLRRLSSVGQAWHSRVDRNG